MAKKPAIPSYSPQDQGLIPVVNALKENLEIITGSRIGIGEIRTLGATASTAEIVSKINEIIGRLNVSGK